MVRCARRPRGVAAHAKETTRIERIAVDAVLAIEHALSHQPTEMPHNNPGYDIESDTPTGMDFIEVKGRVEGNDLRADPPGSRQRAQQEAALRPRPRAGARRQHHHRQVRSRTDHRAATTVADSNRRRLEVLLDQGHEMGTP